MQRNVTLEGFAPQTRLEPQFILSPENRHQYCQNRKSNETSTNNTNKLSGGGTGASFPPSPGQMFHWQSQTTGQGRGDPLQRRREPAPLPSTERTEQHRPSFSTSARRFCPSAPITASKIIIPSTKIPQKPLKDPHETHLGFKQIHLLVCISFRRGFDCAHLLFKKKKRKNNDLERNHLKMFGFACLWGFLFKDTEVGVVLCVTAQA